MEGWQIPEAVQDTIEQTGYKQACVRNVCCIIKQADDAVWFRYAISVSFFHTGYWDGGKQSEMKQRRFFGSTWISRDKVCTKLRWSNLMIMIRFAV